jgi:hypothetical protein
MRKVVEIMLWTAGAVVACCVLFIAFVVFPVPMFPHHSDFNGLSVYSDRAFTSDLNGVLEKTARHLEENQLLTGGVPSRVFLAHSQERYAFLCSVARRRPDTQGLVFTWVGSIIISIPGVEAVRQRTGGLPRNSRLEGNLVEGISHEMAHLQAAAVLDGLGAQHLPRWKSEGWADFAAHRTAELVDLYEPDKGLAARVRLLLDPAAWKPPRTTFDRLHFRWQLMVAYLASVRGLSLEEIADPEVSEDQTWRDLVAWASRPDPKDTVPSD